MWETLLVHAFCPLQSGYRFVKFIPHSKKFLIIHACVTCHIPHGLCHPPWFCQFSDRCSLLLTIIWPGFAIRILLPQLRNPIYTHYTLRPPSGVSCARPEILWGWCYDNFLKYRSVGCGAGILVCRAGPSGSDGPVTGHPGGLLPGKSYPIEQR